MSYEFQSHPEFEHSFKRLYKRYRSLPQDIKVFRDSLQKNPFQGAELYPGIRKIRMPITSKGRGKSGSARVITANAIVAEHEGRIALLTIYDKQDAATVDVKVIRQMAREMGFEV
ncbi:MAG: type II toxin-antitoxin system RelE/ParE family toxin [Bacteroidaceae bacterium]|nr:type II toxin-antitoxin system RelE/ParE family toxin [Bacteroidaceae bacterium]